MSDNVTTIEDDMLARIEDVEREVRCGSDRMDAFEKSLSDMETVTMSLVRESIDSSSVTAGSSVAAGSSVMAGEGFEMPEILGDDVGHVTIPDSFALKQARDQTKRRRSLEWTPENYAALQLNEFDAPLTSGSIHLTASGSVSSGAPVVTISLVDPEDNSGTDRWLLPVRRCGPEPAEIKWIKIGNSVEFTIPSAGPCVPTITASSGATAGTIDLHIQNYERTESGDCVSGSSQTMTIPAASLTLDCCGVRDCINEEVTVLTGVTNTGSGLVFSRAKCRVVGLQNLDPITIAGTTCEDGGSS